MLVKIHDAYRMIVAICDSDVYGRVLQGDSKQLDLSGDFFKGEEQTADDLRIIIDDAAKEDAIFNVVGEESCNLCLDMDIIQEEGIVRIDGVPVAMVLL